MNFLFTAKNMKSKIQKRGKVVRFFSKNVKTDPSWTEHASEKYLLQFFTVLQNVYNITLLLYLQNGDDIGRE